MSKYKNNKGITLVALVVTIIVLIILAGVSISLVLGQDGVVQKAKSGRDNYAEAARLENEQLANVDAFAMDIEDMIPVSQEPEIFTPTGTVSNMTNGEIEISATVSLTGDVDLTKTKYAFTTSNTPLGTDDETLYKDGVITQANETIKKSKAAGTYYLHVLVTSSSGAKGELISNTTATSTVGKKDFNYTGKVQNIELTPGNYKLEVWGAEGGIASGFNSTGGKGGYSIGTINLNANTELFVYVGQAGASDMSDKWNGGKGTDATSFSSSGGGATDISLQGTANSTTWNETKHLYSRIIVAGGGGGAGAEWGGEFGGYGGGTSGGNAGWTNSSGASYTDRNGKGGTQTSAGGPVSGGFGYGGKSTSSTQCGGAGGGWYGGGGQNTSPDAGGGGGSGYVYTESTSSNYPSGCLLNSSYYLTDAQTIAGNTSFTAPTGSSETGHSGNGYARITALD